MKISNTKNSRSGQSIIEYLLVVSAVVVVFIAFLNPFNGKYRQKVEAGVNAPVMMLENMARDLPFPP